MLIIITVTVTVCITRCTGSVLQIIRQHLEGPSHGRHCWTMAGRGWREEGASRDQHQLSAPKLETRIGILGSGSKDSSQSRDHSSTFGISLPVFRAIYIKTP